MFPVGDIVIIKNEPVITNDDIDFGADSSNSLDKVYRISRPKTIICSESEYLAEGNIPFESIVVKEEPNIYDSTTTLDSLKEFSPWKLLVKRWECYICRHEPASSFDLRKHISTRHRTRQNETCQPVPTMKKRFNCDQCDRTFSHTFTLKQHKNIHSGIKPFACGECDRKFSDSSAFRRHKQTHSKERPFACDLCDQTCARKSTLVRHLGTHFGKKSFVCNVCEKKFARNSTLNHHKLFHTGQFPFGCDNCGRKFTLKSSLNYHLQTHTQGPKAFKCDECDRSYGLKGTLNQHKRWHRLKSERKQTTKSTSKGETAKKKRSC